MCSVSDAHPTARDDNDAPLVPHSRVDTVVLYYARADTFGSDASSASLMMPLCFGFACRGTFISAASDNCGNEYVFGAKNVLFAPFIYKNDHFAKTGSGQT
jgi:hypothetical protein